MKIHRLKTINPYFEDVWNGVKRFEVRNNDRDFNIGDYCSLDEYFDDNHLYGNRSILVKITYILKDFPSISESHVVFGFNILKKHTGKY